MKTETLPIENHGVIGDLRTVALVALDATIDFMCWPDFDAPSVFAKLLDDERGGSFAIVPALGDGVRHRQMYLPDTNVLISRFVSRDGLVEVTDLMPIGEAEQRLVRIVHVIHGNVRLHARCAPRFDYARAQHRLERVDEHAFVFWPERGAAMKLSATIPLGQDGDDVTADFSLPAGEHATFLLETYHPDHAVSCGLGGYSAGCFDETVAFWRNWMGRSTYSGRWREIVNRSALVLKLMTSSKHGAIVAAPTFGLPEAPGGTRNWDYRYTWIRDSGFALYALMRLGYTDEAEAFMAWVHQRTIDEHRSGGPPLSVMYRIDGTKNLAESSLPHLRGYGGARPVRIGNGAADQLQLDIHGALLDAVYLSNKYGQPISYDAWMSICNVVNWVCQNWRNPDEGIWEFRGGKREFLHSRLMCWVAVDRAIRLADKRSLPAPFRIWIETRSAIHHDIFDSFWDSERRTFVQHKGSRALDASTLLMPLVRFVSPIDPRWISTLQAIERTLTTDCLVRRYDLGSSRLIDALDGEEGSFTACSFWYVECLARAGRVADARLVFEKMLGFANHLGLFSEELGLAGEHLGNFPQVFTHLALISAAYALDRELSGKPRRAWER
jgi:GH15 family glucan-1,4-alpha-glucosidase